MAAILKFSPSVGYENDVLVSVSQHPGLIVPTGITAHEPTPVTFAQMSKLAPNKFPAPAGLTVAIQPSVKLQGQWKQITTGPVQWQFQGGEIQLAVTIGVYAIDKYLEQGGKLYTLILSHELMHVQDDVEVVTQYLPQELPKDNYVKKYLLDQATVDDAMYHNWFMADRFEKYVRDTWILERNSRGEKRDSGPLYERYKLDIAKLLPRM